MSEATVSDEMGYWTDKSGTKIEYKRIAYVVLTSTSKRKKLLEYNMTTDDTLNDSSKNIHSPTKFARPEFYEIYVRDMMCLLDDPMKCQNIIVKLPGTIFSSSFRGNRSAVPIANPVLTLTRHATSVI